MLHAFRELWILVQGFLDALPSLMWIVVFLLLLCIIPSFVLVSAVGHSTWYQNMNMDTGVYFGSLPRASMTMFQLITFDSWAKSIVRPLGELSAGWYFFFIFIAIFGSWCVLNVIIGVIVERVLQISVKQEEEIDEIVEKLEQSVMEEFHAKLQTESERHGRTPGFLNQDLVDETLEEHEAADMVRTLGIERWEVDELMAIFKMENMDMISVERFVSGLRVITGNATGLDTIGLAAHVRHADHKVRNLHDRAERIIDHIDVVMERLDEFWGMTDAEMNERERRQKAVEDLQEKVKGKKRMLVKWEESKLDWYKQYVRDSKLSKARKRGLTKSKVSRDQTCAKINAGSGY